MNEKVSSLSSFVNKLDAEILKEDQAILLKGGFSSAPTEEDYNDGCVSNNCDCTITTDDYKAHL